ncbi:LuxR C-terminal-related transcriptional regulator [Nocardia sp. NPDC058480]|uniref:response regulator transcription factor n=1 Tax=Actinomycetes TaxID=1760 RepID=UPI00364C9931
MSIAELDRVFGGTERVSPREHTMLIASDSPATRRNFEQVLGVDQRVALIRTSTCHELVENALRCRPDIILLEVSGILRPSLGALIRELRSLDHPPRVALLVPRGTPHPEIACVDAVLTADYGVPAVLESLALVATGVMVAAAPVIPAVRPASSAQLAMRQRLSRLTEREREILRLIVGGLSNRDVGARLFISPDTVKEHVGRILAKLDVATRVEAAVAAVRADRGQWGRPLEHVGAQ